MNSKMANTIRFLCADMVQSANSGHPGAPMGLADIMTVLSNHINHNPKNPTWLNRDRLVFSGGHTSSMIYALLYLWGYDVSLDELKNFRKYGSRTEGHPEYGKIAGIEVTTGPLGQGVANAVGFAMAGMYAKNLLNRENAEIINNKVYCMCGDGDLQEGICYEACALAGHLKLDNLILIYDSNNITIEGDTSIAWSENIHQRFQAQGFDTIEIDGHDYVQIDSALNLAKKSKKPFLIIAKTKIAKGSANLEGSHHTHGSPLGEDEIKASKKLVGFDEHEKFFIDEAVLFRFRTAVEKGDLLEREWKKLLLELPYKEQNEILNSLLNPDFSKIEYPEFKVGEGVATRDSNHKILNAIAKAVPSFIGGSADLAPSNKTELINMGDFPKGKNIHFGIREHAMGAIANGIALYGLFIPFNATFFVFSDYLKPAVRIAALMNSKQFYIWTHDSIGVGEDGPTHQPIEHLSQFRALPNLYMFRPADGVENVESWKVALTLNNPSGFVLSRQKLSVLDRTNAFGDIQKGGYLIKKSHNAQITLIATGSEVELCVKVASKLEEENISVNVVSVPCYELFGEQSSEYKNSIIDKNTIKIAVEAGSGLEWYKYADILINMNSFGASGDANILFKEFGFSVENIMKVCKENLN
ncbi:MAG: transketolase [Campylobacterales bacterium]|nr:transketolase [Campylobacterales bacterium]